MTNRLVQYERPQISDWQSRCDMLNAQSLTYRMERFYFVRHDENGRATGIEHMELPTGTKAWLLDNPKRVKAWIAKVSNTGPDVIEEIYRRAVDAAPVPKSWSNSTR